jgi:hypothetical protein
MSNNKKAVILQPGKLGDILITIPIAKNYYLQGYEIRWPVFDNFISLLNRFDFIKPVSFGVNIENSLYYSNKKRVGFWEEGKSKLEEISSFNKTIFNGIKFFDIFYETYKSDDVLIIDPCFSFPGHRNMHNNNMTSEFQKLNRNWIDLKYHLVNVNLKERWNFSYKRDMEKEEKLFNFIKEYSKRKYNSEEYSIIHSYESANLKKYDVINPINFSYIKDYDILDWLLVLENAKNIVCVDSSLANFVEINPSLHNIKKYYLGSEEPHFHNYMRNILLNNWINLSNSDISYGGFKLE